MKVILSYYGIFATFAVLVILGTVFWNIGYSDATDIIGLSFFGLAALWTLFIIAIGIRNGFVNPLTGPVAKEYVIKEGKHYCNHGVPGLYMFGRGVTRAISKSFSFSSSCLYHMATADDAAINKLTGFGLGLFSGPTANSYRFGWDCVKNDGTISIYAFYHVRGRMLSQYMGDVRPDRIYTYTLVKGVQAVSFTVTDGETRANLYSASAPIGAGRRRSFGWRLYPYFGGQVPAPHDMVIMG